MKKFFTKVKYKISFISLDVIFVYILLGITTNYSINKIKELYDFSDLNNLHSKILSANMSFNNFLINDLKNDEFYKTGNSKNIIDLEQIQEKIATSIELSIKQNTGLTILNKNNNDSLQLINKEITVFFKHFGELKLLYKKRGNQNSGLINTLFLLHQEIKEQLEQLAINNEIQIHQFNEHYIYLNKDNLFDDILNYNDQLLEILSVDTAINTTGFNDFFIDIDALQLNLKNYSVQIKKLRKLNKDLGLMDKKGLIQKQQELINSIDSLSVALKKEIRKNIDSRISKFIILIGVLIFVFGLFTLFVIFLIKNSIVTPLIKIRKYTQELSLGQFPDKLILKQDDEITDILKNINTLYDGLKDKDNFAKEIENGNLNSSIQQLSDNDTLSHSLEDMQKSLIQAQKERQIRQNKEKQQKWISTGIAEFAAILRQNNDNLNVLGDEIIRNLIHYVDANQGGIFLYQKDDSNNEKYMELIASYAYNRKKFISKKIELGVGLIGNIALEQKMIHLHKLPSDYLEITSGLGEAEPSDLVVLPLIFNEVFYGAIEVASFEKLDEYKIEFLKLICDNIASTFASVKVNMQTTKLLQQSNFQSEELSSQEEEMRQNMEELQATQEEASRREMILQELVDAIDAANFVLEYDVEGRITKANTEVSKVFNLKKEELHKKTIYELLGDNELADSILKQVLSGQIIKHTDTIALNGKTYWLQSTYSPLKSEAGYINKIIQFAYDMTETKLLEQKVVEENEIIKKQEQELNQKLTNYKSKELELDKTKIQFVELKRNIDNVLYHAEFDHNFIFTYINKRFLVALGYSEEEILGQPYDILSVENDIYSSSKILQLLKAKDTVRLKTEKQTKTGTTLKLYLTYNINQDTLKGEDKIVMIAHEVMDS